ncbi:hypothetical protein CDAR_300181 [Caerostris darwini]|uniref:Uncharacterized protein n=1 Tax=Caerostris darwini TaxID=1538125 RepID=A0AAV4W353_9ARAC|nr:hypothetical protein CDAR_300181 [Caerostris darwini]
MLINSQSSPFVASGTLCVSTHFLKLEAVAVTFPFKSSANQTIAVSHSSLPFRSEKPARRMFQSLASPPRTRKAETPQSSRFEYYPA